MDEKGSKSRNDFLRVLGGSPFLKYAAPDRVSTVGGPALQACTKIA
jgi:hypothetical protein